MSNSEGVDGIYAAYIFLLIKCGDEEIVDVGGLVTFSKKESGMQIISWQI
jgi:hypothetical protein